MSYIKKIFDSDLDAFKNESQIRTASLTFSGTLAGAGEQNVSSSAISVSGLDFNQILFDNSIQHSGKYKRMALEGGRTAVYETTTPSYLIAFIYVKVTGTTIQFHGRLINPYAGNVALQSTTINFRYIPYQATF